MSEIVYELCKCNFFDIKVQVDDYACSIVNSSAYSCLKGGPGAPVARDPDVTCFFKGVC